jgi:hypothetical protein
MHFLKLIINFYVSYVFRTSWVHPQEDICICSKVCFTCIGVSSLVDKRVSNTVIENMPPKY